MQLLYTKGEMGQLPFFQLRRASRAQGRWRVSKDSCFVFQAQQLHKKAVSLFLPATWILSSVLSLRPQESQHPWRAPSLFPDSAAPPCSCVMHCNRCPMHCAGRRGGVGGHPGPGIRVWAGAHHTRACGPWASRSMSLRPRWFLAYRKQRLGSDLRISKASSIQFQSLDRPSQSQPPPHPHQMAFPQWPLVAGQQGPAWG